MYSPMLVIYCYIQCGVVFLNDRTSGRSQSTGVGRSADFDMWHHFAHFKLTYCLKLHGGCLPRCSSIVSGLFDITTRAIGLIAPLCTAVYCDVAP